MSNRPVILIVDDVDFFLEVEKGFLKNTFAEIITARNGQQALDTIAVRRPDLIYLDVNMPVMDGIACCRAIKADPQLRDIPVIVVYASGRENDQETQRTSGCDGILHKPVDRKEFLELGRQFLPQVDRRFARVRCEMTVEFTLDGVVMQGEGFNISRNGMYVQFRDLVPDKARLRLRFLLPTVSSERLEVWGEVAWTNFGFPRGKLDLPQGFGVEFKLLNARQEELIEQFITEGQSQSESERGK